MPRPPRSRPASRPPAALARVAPLITRWVERLLGELSPRLTLAQYLSLESLDQGQTHAAALAEGAGVSRSAVSQLVGSLRELGLVEAAGPAEDRRRQPLALSSDGRRALRAARERLRRGLTPLLDRVPPHEVDGLARALETIEQSLRGAPPPPRAPRPRPPGGGRL